MAAYAPAQNWSRAQSYLRQHADRADELVQTIHLFEVARVGRNRDLVRQADGVRVHLRETSRAWMRPFDAALIPDLGVAEELAEREVKWVMDLWFSLGSEEERLHPGRLGTMGAAFASAIPGSQLGHLCAAISA